MIHDPRFAAELRDARAAAAPRATEPQVSDAAAWFALAVAFALFAMMAIQGWLAVVRHP